MLGRDPRITPLSPVVNMVPSRVELAMASEKQVQANRANAKRSTGPKTEPGKALSRRNAYKHGLTAQTIVIGDEDPKAFDRLRAELEEEYNPRPGIERELVERLAVLMWRMRRIPIFEAGLIELRRRRDRLSSPEPVIAFQNCQGTLGTLFRYEAALMNAFSRTLQQLLVLQDRRASESDGDQADGGEVIDVLPSPPH
jgi:hypothetical protein